jgi:hypothetical protein
MAEGHVKVVGENGKWTVTSAMGQAPAKILMPTKMYTDPVTLKRSMVLRTDGTPLRPMDEIDRDLRAARAKQRFGPKQRAVAKLGPLASGVAATTGQRMGDEAAARAMGLTEATLGLRKSAVRLEQKFSDAVHGMNSAMMAADGYAAKPMQALHFASEPPSASAGLIPLMPVSFRGMGFQGEFYAHPYIAREFMARNSNKALDVGEIHLLYRKVLSWWKRLATIYYPGFHARNMVGAFMNNIAGGVGTKDYGLSYKLTLAARSFWDWGEREGGAIKRGQIAEMLLPQKEYEYLNLQRFFGPYNASRQWTYMDVVDLYQSVGVGQMNSRAISDTLEAFNAMEKETARMRARTPVGKMLGFWENKMFRMNEGIESLHRFAAMNHGMAGMGGDIWGARGYTMVRHGDYTDLTDMEHLIKDMVPFYKWMRTNIPYQFTLLTENPGLLTIYDKTERAAFEGQGLDWWETQAKMPDWMANSFTIPINLPGTDKAMEFVMMDLPYQDLYMSAGELVSRMMPLIRPMVESVVTHQSVFTGRPIEKEIMVPMAGWISDIPLVPDLLSHLGIGMKDVDGTWKIPSTWENVMNTLPLYTKFRNWILGDETNERARAGAFFSLLMGTSYRPFNEDDLQSSEVAFLKSQVEPAVKKFRDAGIMLPETMRIDPRAYVNLGMVPPISGSPTTTDIYDTLKLDN